MESPTLQLSAQQSEICGCAVTDELNAGHSWLAHGPGGRAVVLKRIDAECLLKDALHPMVRDRLSRVRELAHASVANLFGVERDGDGVYLLWEYVHGEQLDIFTADDRSPREVAAVARELALAVDLLHVQGIVHGALIGSNVIVTPRRTVRLTHISPLMYTDPKVDVECVWNLLELAAEHLDERGAALMDLVVEGRANNWPLRQLATRLGSLSDGRDVKKPAPVDVEETTKSPRRRALFGAAVVAALGLGLAWGAWHVVETGRLSLPSGLPHAFHTQGDGGHP